jgi:prevent-host-death family protein
MDTYSIAEAKAQLSKLIKRAGKGREIVITRHGKPVARIQPIARPQGRVDVEWLVQRLKKQPKLRVSIVEEVRKMRDEE